VKIGIVTFTNGINYGCKLQNYALLTALQEMYPDNQILTINNDKITNDWGLKKLKRDFKSFIFSTNRFVCDKRKEKIFAQFDTNYLKKTKTILSDKTANEFSDYDAIVCGSDQIWNPYYVQNIGFNTGNFARKAKRISYAASIGVEEIPQNRIEEYVEEIGSLDAISVRETGAAELLSKLLSRNVAVSLDPTLLLDKSDWVSFEKKPKQITDEKYVLTYFLTGEIQNRYERIKDYANSRGLKLIELNSLNCKTFYDISPNEFIYLIHHCDTFFTDSFHGTVFSILFKKKFFVFPRGKQRDDGRQRQAGRVETLLAIVNLKDRFITEDEYDVNSVPNYDNSDEKIVDQKEKSIEYLRNALKANDNVNTAIAGPENCCGCGACAESCPTDAITMQLCEDEFYYPKVDNTKCVGCKKCLKVCPELNNLSCGEHGNAAAFCIENQDDNIRRLSSSGGVFYSFAKKLIEEGGVVFSPVFDKNMFLEHRMITNMEELLPALGSKYVQSNIEGTFEECKKVLEEGRKVLYTGTPCQVYALRGYLGKDYENLVTQDLICHGNTSPHFFRRYLEWAQKESGKRITSISFRKKNPSWLNFGVEIGFDDGSKRFEKRKDNVFMSLFLRNYSLRLSCFKCSFRKKARVADITLGDYWGLEKHDDKGSSLVICNTSKGRKLLNSVLNEFSRVEETGIDEGVKENSAYYHDIPVPYGYKTFCLDREKFSFPQLYKKYIEASLLKKIRNRVKKWLGQ